MFETGEYIVYGMPKSEVEDFIIARVKELETV